MPAFPYKPPPKPRPLALEKVSSVVGGLWDTRPARDWLPEDGFAPTALSGSGKHLGRLQCCGSQSRGGRCCRRVLEGVGFCHGHKQVAPVGVDPRGPEIRFRKRMQFHQMLRGEERERFAALSADLEDLLDPTEPLALVTMRIQAMLARAPSGDTEDFRLTAFNLFEAWRRLSAGNENNKATAALAQLGDHLSAGVDGDKCWTEAVRLSEARLRHSAEARRVASIEEDALSRPRVIAIFKGFQQILADTLTTEDFGRVMDRVEQELLAVADPAPPKQIAVEAPAS